jgi:hypothetical protein
MLQAAKSDAGFFLTEQATTRWRHVLSTDDSKMVSLDSVDMNSAEVASFNAMLQVKSVQYDPLANAVSKRTTSVLEQNMELIEDK